MGRSWIVRDAVAKSTCTGDEGGWKGSGDPARDRDLKQGGTMGST